MTNEQHNKYLGISFLVHAGFQLFWMLMMGLMMFFFFTSIPTKPGEPEPPTEFFTIIFAFMFVIQMIFTAPSVVAAYAILKRKSWARLAGIIGAVMASMSVPIGTGVCVYALWFLLGDKWKSVYSASAEGGVRCAELREATDSPWWTANAKRVEQEREQTQRPPDWR